MRRSSKYVDFGSAVVILVTLTLFVLALFAKGLTHDLLLETGIFLVSVKLIIMGYQNAAAARSVHEKLDDIQSRFQRLDDPRT